MKRKKAILCALASIGIMTSAGTVKANAMTNNTNTTTKCIKPSLSVWDVEESMYDLHYTIDTTSLKAQLKDTADIIDVSIAYNSLSDKDQKRIDPDAVYNLKHAEENIRRVYGDEIKAIDLVCKVSILEHQLGINKNTNSIENKSAVQSNRKDIQKEIEKLEKNYQSLDYSIRFKNGLPNFMNRLTKIELKLANME